MIYGTLGSEHFSQGGHYWMKKNHDTILYIFFCSKNLWPIKGIASGEKRCTQKKPERTKILL